MTNLDKVRQRELWFRNNVIDKIENMLYGSDSNVSLVSFVVFENELIRLKQRYSDKLKITTMPYDENNRNTDKLIVIVEKPRNKNYEHQEKDYLH